MKEVNIMKKILSLILVFSMIASAAVIPAFAAQETEADSETYGTEYVAEIEILKQLGIADEDVDLSKKITRKEFAQYVAKMLNLDESSHIDKQYFTDVASGSVVNDLVELGIFGGTGVGTFDPDSEIVLSHACAALVRALGYTYANTENSLAVYNNLAARLDIDDDVEYSDGATNLNILLMIYNTLMAKAGEQSIYIDDNGNPAYDVKSSKDSDTLMESVFDAYVLEDGIVTETYLTSLNGSGTLDKNQIKIGSRIYKCEIDETVDLIGQHVTALVSDKDTVENVICIVPDENANDYVIIDAQDISGFDNYCLTYFDENNKKQEVRFESSMSVIYNGVAESKNFKKLFDFKSGSVKCIKGSDSRYSVAVIEAFENVRVSKAPNLHDMIVYTESVAPYNALNFTKNDDTFRKVYLASNGSEIGATVLVSRDMLSVARSKDGKYIKAYLCTETVTGKLSGVTSSGKKLYTIGENQYEAAYGFNPLEKYDIGDSVSYILDITGKLMAVSDANTTGDKIVGYLYQKASSDGLASEVKVKIYTQNKEHKVYKLADKVEIDGQTYSKSDALKALCDDSGTLKRNIVLFKANSKDELIYIDTPAASKEVRESENSLWVYEQENSFKYDDSNQMFFPKYPLWYNTYIFCIPTDDDSNPQELSFNVYMDRKGPFIRKTNYTVAMYKFSDDTPFIDVITYRLGDKYTGEIHEMERVMLVDEIKTVRDEDGVGVKAICGIESGAYKEYRVENGVDISNIGEGDVIRTGRNGRGYVAVTEVLYDYSEDKTNWSGFASKTYDTNGRFVLGYLASVYHYNEGGTNNGKNSAVSVSQTLGGDVEELYLLDTNSNNFMIYDSSRREYKSYIGSINEAVSYDLGTGSASRIFIHTNGTQVVSVILYI